jgi:hypothetical protein
MIIAVRVNNYLVYSNEVELSLVANMKIKKFSTNVYKEKRFNILKSACIYGANNSGKTCLIRAINTIKNVLLGYVAEVPYNIYTGSNTCSFGISFLYNGRAFNYDFKFDSTINNNQKNGFVYERLSELFIDQYGNNSDKEIFLRDVIHDKYSFQGDEELGKILNLVSSNNILIYTLNTVKYPKVEEYKQILRGFASRIEVLDMNNIPIERTISVLKNNEQIKEKTVELIKLADLDIEDYKYFKSEKPVGESGIAENGTSPIPQEVVLKNSVLIDDMYRLTSVHKGRPVVSLTFDSTGTKKVVAVASYIVEALMVGKILVVDELDSSLHFKLTRALVALFNNNLNKNAQLIFTAHDVTLLDCKKLFRKDQIWFASKDENNEYLYSLDDYKASNDHIRAESDIFEKYNSGVLGAIPDPDLINVLLEGDENDTKDSTNSER